MITRRAVATIWRQRANAISTWESGSWESETMIAVRTPSACQASSRVTASSHEPTTCSS